MRTAVHVDGSVGCPEKLHVIGREVPRNRIVLLGDAQTPREIPVIDARMRSAHKVGDRLISSGVLAMAPAGGKNGSSGMNLDPTFLMFSLIPGGNFTGGTTVLAGVGVLLGGVLCLTIRAGW